MNNEKSNVKKWILAIVGIIAFFWLGTLAINSMFFKHEEPLVYVTNTGECYHSLGCSYLKSVNPIGLEQAKDKGYRSCSRCNGEPNGVVEVNEYGKSFGILFGITFIGGFIGIFIWGNRDNKKQVTSTNSNGGFYSSINKGSDFVVNKNLIQNNSEVKEEMELETKFSNDEYNCVDAFDLLSLVTNNDFDLDKVVPYVKKRFDGGLITEFSKFICYDIKNKMLVGYVLVEEFTGKYLRFKEIHNSCQLAEKFLGARVGSYVDNYVVLQIVDYSAMIDLNGFGDKKMSDVDNLLDNFYKNHGVYCRANRLIARSKNREFGDEMYLFDEKADEIAGYNYNEDENSNTFFVYLKDRRTICIPNIEQNDYLILVNCPFTMTFLYFLISNHGGYYLQDVG